MFDLNFLKFIIYNNLYKNNIHIIYKIFKNNIRIIYNG